MNDAIQLTLAQTVVAACAAVILVPDAALDEAGHIKLLSMTDGAHSKHEFYALAQMALMQFEDGELTPQRLDGTLDVQRAEESHELAGGLCIYRGQAGELGVVVTTGGNVRRYLETANRYCTRWVRLDI